MNWKSRPTASNSSNPLSVVEENVVKELLPVQRLECAIYRALSLHGSARADATNCPIPRPEVDSTVPLRLRYSNRLRTYQGPASNTNGAQKSAAPTAVARLRHSIQPT